MNKAPKPTKWHKLDNTANVFPVVASKRMTSVFRITAVLNEIISPIFLQKAVEMVLPHFSAFSVRLRHGLFWSYFETNTAPVSIEPDNDYPCRFIDPLETNRYLFRVLYFNDRIHLEVFHALTDGTGGMWFLRAICYQYIKLAHEDDFTAQEKAFVYGVENAGNIEDGYLKSYVPTKSQSFKEPKPFRVKGDLRVADSTSVNTGILSVAQLKTLCKAQKASISEYLAAVLIMGIYKSAMSINGSSRPINIFLPVNLRNMFESQTSLNFFSTITITVFTKGANVQFLDVLDAVKKEFAQKLNRDYVAKRLAYTVKTEENIFTRITPLPLKNSIIRLVFEQSSGISTMSFSNLGVVAIEERFQKYFKGFRFLIYPVPKDPVKCAVASFGDECSITFTSSIEGQGIAREVFRFLAKQGLSIQLEGNVDNDEIL